MSTDSPGFDPAAPYRLNPRVALRPEPFGALAYHFGTRKLSFLKAPALVELVRDLEAHPTVLAAVDHLAAPEKDRYLRALATLAETDMIVPA
ncbi:mycofactocin biosynthesis chaperone MftB [Labedaea rhizosphaerae]|uniref:Putative mycofactocin binding protein MftB n=1 Tax=Labedaea rhizosphaerae TaxID=598644 RepID=A0A4R6S4G8_LABRH|nr:mycofactocin biosynthesis chaperone MftB [Labedaea rhizosphaerae]TDP93987.1 putative mycofactocin binding protein MftB [Labedaea rhizosphaerae]